MSTMIVKTPCQKCHKKNAVKSLVTFVPNDCVIETLSGCHKCGWKPMTS